MRDIKILKSKLVRPKTSNTIPRSRLLPLWDEAKDKRLVTVVAGAGYGKTTLVNRASRMTDIDTLWYKLDQGDSDLITFIRYLVAGVSFFYPGFGNETLKRLRLIKSLKQDQGEILNLFMSEIESHVKDHLIIILDDFHLVDDSSEITTAVEYMIEHFSEWVHFAIVSRRKPNIKMSRLRASRDILEITENELVFSQFEIESLFKDTFNIELTKDNIHTLQTKTGGWITGLILFYHFHRKKPDANVEKQLSGFSGSNTDITSYIDENVYEQLPEHIRNFLVKTSILSRFTTDFCNRFLETDTAEEILGMLSEKHLFIFSYTDESQWFYYHQIFQDYLVNRFNATFSKTEIQKIHSNAAEHWLRLDEPEEALNHLISAGDFEKACSYFDQVGRYLRYEGKLLKVHAMINKIPDEYLSKYPWIIYNSGNIYDLMGQPAKAIGIYEKALALFSETSNDKGAGLCLNRLVNNYCITGKFQKAEATIKKVLEQFHDNIPIYITSLGFLICILAMNQKMDEAEERCQDGLKLQLQPGDEIYRVWLYCTTAFYLCTKGHFEEALDFMEKARAICREFENHPVVFSVEHIMSWITYSLGNFEYGLKEAESALKKAKNEGYKDFNYAWLNVYACLNAAELGLYEEAKKLGEAGLEGFRRCESIWAQGLALYALSILELKSGDLQKAASHAEESIQLIKNCDTIGFLGAVKSNLARILAKKQLTPDIKDLFETAEPDLHSFRFYLFRHHIWKTRFLWASQMFTEAEDSLETALSISGEDRYSAWIKKESEWILSPLVSLYLKERLPETINGVICKLGINIVDPLLQYIRNNKNSAKKTALMFLKNIQSTMPKQLKVNCLGPFQVFLGEMEIKEDFWTSLNAKTLFKYLILNKTAGYKSKENLQELLWPDEDPEKTTNRLHVTLNALRKTLEPSLPPRGESSFLLRKGDSYRLNPGQHGSTDIETFQEYMTRARDESDMEKAINYYLIAESLYRGDLFNEDPYAEWCQHEKEVYKQDYCNITNTIIGYYFKNDDIRNVISFASRLIRTDPYNEDGYLHLMRLYARTGNINMFSKTFDKCRHIFENELDLPMSSEAIALHEKIIGQKRT